MTATQRERVAAYLQSALSSEPEYLWARYPDWAVYRHPVSRKWFALLLRLPSGDRPWALVLKADPVLLGSLLREEGFLPAYHMNREHWVTALMDGPLPDARILPLLDMAWRLAAPARGRNPQ